MKRVYKGTLERDKFFSDLKNDEFKNDTFVVLTKELNNEMQFLKRTLGEKNNHNSISVGDDYIVIEPMRCDDNSVHFIDIPLVEILSF